MPVQRQAYTQFKLIGFVTVSLGIRFLLQYFIWLLCASTGMAWGEASVLRVAVLENSPPMSYLDSAGRQTGFSVEISRALCEEMRARCEIQAMPLARVVDSLVRDEIDIAAVSLLETPERRSKILLAKPYFRSISLWFAMPEIKPGHPGVHVAVVKGSVQEKYAVQQNWPIVGVSSNGVISESLLAGVAQATIISMSTGLNLQKNKDFQKLGMEATVMSAPELSGQASFGINPRHPEIKVAIDEALERIKRNGVYDRINTQFLPFRVN